MKIDGLDEKIKPVFEELGEFKLKDRAGRDVVEIDLLKLDRPLNEAKKLFVSKTHGVNNKVKISIEWKPEKKK